MSIVNVAFGSCVSLAWRVKIDYSNQCEKSEKINYYYVNSIAEMPSELVLRPRCYVTI